MEKLVHQQISAYLDHYCLFSPDQHGFTARHSTTTTALLTVTDQIFQGMDHSEITLLALIGLSCCFDVVYHATLLTSFEQLQISTGWIRSYLTGHTQRVRVGETLSEPVPLTLARSRPWNVELFLLESSLLSEPVLESLSDSRTLDISSHWPSYRGLLTPLFCRMFGVVRQSIW